MCNTRCKYCHSSKTKLHGKSARGMQRYRCLKCYRTWSRSRKKYKVYSSQKLFRWWLEGYSVQKIAAKAKLSRSHTYRILLTKLLQPVPYNESALRECKYASFDGKFLFGREWSALILFDAIKKLPIAVKLAKNESRASVASFMSELKQVGFNPIAITIDGRSGTPTAMKTVFPSVVIQRCLFHIKLQIWAWVRIPPRTELGWALKHLADQIGRVSTQNEQIKARQQYEQLKQSHAVEIEQLIKRVQDKYNRPDYDMLKCFTLLDNAWSSLFHYVDNLNIAKTSSPLEGFNKQITRIKGFDHCGLNKNHLEQFLKHYINTIYSNTK